MAIGTDQMTYEDLPRDTTPVSSEEAEYPCEVCGAEAGPYGGRGPKPKKCPAHKSGASKMSARTTPRNSNAKLATQAADALVQGNMLIGLAANGLGFDMTQQAIGMTHEGFREAAYNALVNDPELCRMILRGGLQSGRFSLLIAYGMLLAAITPTFKMELEQKRAERKARRDEAGTESV